MFVVRVTIPRDVGSSVRIADGYKLNTYADVAQWQFVPQDEIVASLVMSRSRVRRKGDYSEGRRIVGKDSRKL